MSARELLQIVRYDGIVPTLDALLSLSLSLFVCLIAPYTDLNQ
jgi:hypothetical protein